MLGSILYSKPKINKKMLTGSMNQKYIIRILKKYYVSRAKNHV